MRIIVMIAAALILICAGAGAATTTPRVAATTADTVNFIPVHNQRTLISRSRLSSSGNKGAVGESGLPVMNPLDAVGYVASGLVFAAFCMKDIIPLRLVAIFSNVAFLTYGLGMGLTPVWLLHAILLPINCWRLWQGCFTKLDELQQFWISIHSVHPPKKANA